MTAELARLSKMIINRVWLVPRIGVGRNLIVPLAITTLSLSLAGPIVLYIASAVQPRLLRLLKRASSKRTLKLFTLPSSSVQKMSVIVRNPHATDFRHKEDSSSTSDTLTEGLEPLQLEGSAKDLVTSDSSRESHHLSVEFRTSFQNEMIAHWLAEWIVDHFEKLGRTEPDTQVHLATKIYNALDTETGLNPHPAVICASAYYSKTLLPIIDSPDFDHEEMFTLPPGTWGVEAECDCGAERLFKWWIISLHLAKAWWDGIGYSMDMLQSWTTLPYNLCDLMEQRALEEFGYGTLLFTLELSSNEEWHKFIQNLDDHLWRTCSDQKSESDSSTTTTTTTTHPEVRVPRLETDWEMYAIVRRLLFLNVKNAVDQRPSESRPWVCEGFCESPGPMSSNRFDLRSRFSDSDEEEEDPVDLSSYHSLSDSDSSESALDPKLRRVSFETEAVRVSSQSTATRRKYPRSPCPSFMITSRKCKEEMAFSSDPSEDDSKVACSRPNINYAGDFLRIRTVEIGNRSLLHRLHDWDDGSVDGSEDDNIFLQGDGGYDGDDEDDDGV
ncbi:hypothetical protein K435DRAFT_797665 [Dendrothele bispora CBS 962.96]|uniref:Uncharacterized protein n=1 Tax=Dendrothele bispora (strain CBS 962.96) TaxID=1314807 RepID=A0A4S8M1T8_DENBC|nr:hypothetical protein K435DRAFT_797665 [Dendrothele bispora CBS 962.96]